MNKILLWSICAALAGFLFGFDTVVISGADQQLQTLWGTSDFVHGTIVMAMALWGTVVGAIFGGIPTNKLGRKKTLIIIGVLYLISALGSALVDGPYIFAFFRFIGGLGVGASTIAAPAYVSEIAPGKDRGRLVALYQFNIVLGILIAFLSNYLLRDTGEEPWRWMLGVEAIPAFIYILFTFTIPESPRWLISVGRMKDAEKTLKIIDPEFNVDKKINEIENQLDEPAKKESVLAKKYRYPLILAILIAFFNQFSGINAFLYYAPRIFQEAGLGEETAFLSSIGIGIVNLIFTLFGVFLIDRLGRKKLMYIGSIGYIISLSLVSAAFFLNWSGFYVPLFLFVFIASHAIGQGAVIWVFIAEIFPNSVRAAGQSYGVSTHWLLAAIIPSLMPTMISLVGAGTVFAIFAIMMVLQLLFVMFMMPETKGKSLEELSEELSMKKL